MERVRIDFQLHKLELPLLGSSTLKGTAQHAGRASLLSLLFYLKVPHFFCPYGPCPAHVELDFLSFLFSPVLKNSASCQSRCIPKIPPATSIDCSMQTPSHYQRLIINWSPPLSCEYLLALLGMYTWPVSKPQVCMWPIYFGLLPSAQVLILHRPWLAYPVICQGVTSFNYLRSPVRGWHHCPLGRILKLLVFTGETFIIFFWNLSFHHILHLSLNFSFIVFCHFYFPVKTQVTDFFPHTRYVISVSEH